MIMNGGTLISSLTWYRNWRRSLSSWFLVFRGLGLGVGAWFLAFWGQRLALSAWWFGEFHGETVIGQKSVVIVVAQYVGVNYFFMGQPVRRTPDSFGETLNLEPVRRTPDSFGGT